MIIDWPGLRAAATAAAGRAYAPYSGLRVGAAGLAADGRVITGCNVENASYGLTLCAECGLVSALHASGAGALHVAGAGALRAVAVVAGDGEPLLPCGRCRQLLLEAGGGEGGGEQDVQLDGAIRGVDQQPSAADVAARRDPPTGSAP